METSLYRMFAVYGMAGWYRAEYETMNKLEVVKDLEARKAPVCGLFSKLRYEGCQ